VRDSKSQANVAKHTGRPERRLDSCAACVSALASNPIAFFPTVHYRRQAGKLETRAGKTRSRQALSMRMALTGSPTRHMSGSWARTDEDLCTSCPQGSNRFSTAPPISRERPGYQIGSRDHIETASPRPCQVLRRDSLAGVSRHVGLTPSVLTESCPSLGRSRTGGAIPPDTNGQPL